MESNKQGGRDGGRACQAARQCGRRHPPPPRPLAPRQCAGDGGSRSPAGPAQAVQQAGPPARLPTLLVASGFGTR